MKDREKYVGIIRDKDKIIALDKKNQITSWDMCTGKVLSQFKLKKEYVTPEYKIYSCDGSDITYKTDWNQPRFLIFNDTKEIEMD